MRDENWSENRLLDLLETNLEPTASVHQRLQPVDVSANDHLMDRVNLLKELRDLPQELVHVGQAGRLILQVPPITIKDSLL